MLFFVSLVGFGFGFGVIGAQGLLSLYSGIPSGTQGPYGVQILKPSRLVQGKNLIHYIYYGSDLTS